MLADLEVVDRRLERLEASIKKQRKDAEVPEQALLARLKTELESETPLRAVTAHAGRGPRSCAASPSCRRSRSSTASTSRRRRSPRASAPSRATASARWRARPQTRVGWVSAVIEAEIAALAGRGAAGLPGRPRARRAGDQPRAARLLRAARPGLASSRRARTRCAPGRSRPAPARRTPPAPCTRTSRAASSAPRSTATTSSSPSSGSFADLRAKGQLRLEGKDYVVQRRRDLPLPVQRREVASRAGGTARALVPGMTDCSAFSRRAGWWRRSRWGSWPGSASSGSASPGRACSIAGRGRHGARPSRSSGAARPDARRRRGRGRPDRRSLGAPADRGVPRVPRLRSQGRIPGTGLSGPPSVSHDGGHVRVRRVHGEHAARRRR